MYFAPSYSFYKLVDVLAHFHFEHFINFFYERSCTEDETDATTTSERTEYWLQRFVAIAQSIGISKHELLYDYYYDEFLVVMEAYNDMHSLNTDKEKEVFADEI